MQLVEKHIIQRNGPRFPSIDAACFASKKLYNAALYVIRQVYITEGKYLSSGDHQTVRAFQYSVTP